MQQGIIIAPQGQAAAAEAALDTAPAPQDLPYGPTLWVKARCGLYSEAPGVVGLASDRLIPVEPRSGVLQMLEEGAP